MGALVDVSKWPPPSWVVDSVTLREAVVLVIERERAFYRLSQADSGGAAWCQAGLRALEAWQLLADALGVEVEGLLDAADRTAVEEVS